MPTGFYVYYLQQKQNQLFVSDLQQDIAAQQLDGVAKALTNQQQRLQAQSGISRFFGRVPKPVKGMYLWGHAGSGKTWLMRCFYDYLSIDNKVFIHFHQFMRQVHEALARTKTKKNPLQDIAIDWANKTAVICLDEFIVTNIADAMLLYRLLEALLEQRVVLVMTSNRCPDDLYSNGLQRALFLPAIVLIKEKLKACHLDTDMDFRRDKVQADDAFFVPQLDAQILQRYFAKFAGDEGEKNQTMMLNNRSFHCLSIASNAVWFEFGELCTKPRAVADFEQLAKRFDRVFLSNVPLLDESYEAEARRFMYLIDELYLYRVKLLISAEVEADFLYQGRLLEFAFPRTVSRLIEMSSSHYFHR